jgi:signal transduction histidine kinase
VISKQQSEANAEQQLQKQKILRNSFIAGSILLLLLIVLLINRNKLKRGMEMERMRSRLSRDLHDDIGSTLSSINILSRTAQSNLTQSQDEKTKASLEKINERSQRLLDNMSDIIWNINPGNDTIEEVMSRMREYATTILEAKNIDYTFNFPKEKMDCTLTMEVKNNMYLIFKEAVNNLSKYSGATNATLSLTFDEKNIHLKVEDNGKGFDENEIKHRGGLVNMQHRAEEIKGVIHINSVLEKGTVIELSMPRYC